MKNTLLILLFLAFLPSYSRAQIYGRVVDAYDNSPLPFATVVGEDTYAIANEEGQFKYRGEPGDRLTVSFLGYRDTMVLAKPNMVIKMINDGIYSEEVVITDANYISPYELIVNTKKKYKSYNHEVIPSKLFVKRETYNNGEWSDQTETLYNVKQHKGKIYDLAFQHGKSYVNSSNDLIFTLDLLTVLKEEELFGKYSKYLYTSACSIGSARKMKKKYQGNYREWTSNGKKYYIVDTKAREDNKFDSEVTMAMDDYDAVRIKHKIVNPTQTVFRSLLDNKPISLDSISLEYTLEDWQDEKVISTMIVKYAYYLNGISSENIINIKFFDYGKPFIDLISSIDYESLTDYQRIWNTPYNDEFWNGQKLTFSKLDTLSDFLELNIESSNLLLRKRYLTISEARSLGLKHFDHIPLMDDAQRAMIKFDPIDQKTQRHLHAHLFAHCYTVDGKMNITLMPLIDQQRSFVLKVTPMMDSLFNKEIDVVEEVANEANAQLKAVDLAQDHEDIHKDVSRIVREYNDEIKDRLSEYDNHQNRDWGATGSDPWNQKRRNRRGRF